MSSFLLVAKAGHASASALGKKMLAWLRSRDAEATLLPANIHPRELRSAARGRDAVIILGGDGTVLGVCRKMLACGRESPPYLGINFGNIGFLAEFSPKKWETCLTMLLSGQLRIKPRLALAWSVPHKAEGLAINDIVVGRGALARVLPLHVAIEDASSCISDLGWMRGDGVLVASPQGSSAYNLSAHGAMVHTNVHALTMTPVSPFFRSFPPMVLPADFRIHLATEPLLPDRDGQTTPIEAFLTIDGQDCYALAPGDAVIVRGIDEGFAQLTMPKDTWISRLHERGFI